MKNLRIIAVILVLIQVLYGHITSAVYYKIIFTNVSSNIQPLIQTICWMAADATILVCGLLFFVSSTPAVKNKTYALLRFMFVVSALLMLPSLLLYIFKIGFYQHVEMELAGWLFFAAWRLVWLITVVLLIIARPVSIVQSIDLSEYQQVSYTSTWHRFMHYLLDSLFLLPLILYWIGFVPQVYDSTLVLEGVLILVYFVYCFISEAFFRQTFGKIITGSCIVSNGVELSTGRVLIRTLSRLIPFDKLSFLFGGNWHDRVSSTTVVYIDSWEKAFDEPSAYFPE